MFSFSCHCLTPGGIALLYAGFAALWIVASDGLLSLAIDDLTLLVRLSVIKGVAFVGVTAALVYFLLRGWRQSLITELLAQAAEQDRLLRQFYELPFIGMALTSPESKRWLQVNDRLCEILGYSREALAEMTWREMTHPDDLDADVAEFDRVIRGESEGYTMDKRFIRQDGAVVFATVNVKCLRRADGRVDTFIATISDITERQQAAEQIRRLNRLYRMLSNINQIIVRRKEPESMMSEACQIAVRADIDQLYDLEQRKAEGEYRITCQDGSQRDWEFSSVGLGQLADGRRIAISMAADVTEHNWAMTALRQREWQYRQLFEANPHPMWVYDLETLRFLAVNDAAIAHYGFSRDEFLAMTITEIRPPEDIPRLLANVLQVQNGAIDEAGVWKHLKKDGSPIDVEITSHVLEFAGRRAEVVLAHDISQRLRTEEALRQAAIVFENTREGITITDAEERILRVNRAFCDLTGYTEEEVRGKTPRLLHSARQNRAFYVSMWTRLRETGHWQGEIWNRRKNGEVYPELLSISAVKNADGAITHYVGVFADLSQIKASEERLDFLAHHDPLTGLPNRLLLLARLQHSIDSARRDGATLALLMLDLDRFKDVNESHGHSAGDALLQQVAERLTHRLRGVDTVTRLGGDEFAVLLEDLTQPQDAARVAIEIIDLLSEPWCLAHGGEVRLGASLGISLFPDHGQTAEDLLQQADAALYQAKNEGRGRFQYFSADLTQAARQRIELEARLRRAINENQLRVYYQPQVDIPSGRIVGAEALVRWQDPEHGLIPPGRFIPLAEETGLISAIGEWVLRETCRQGKVWLDAGLPPLTLSVNLSAHQLHHGDLVATVMQTLRESGFPAEWLELELTESALMQREVEAVTLDEILDSD